MGAIEVVSCMFCGRDYPLYFRRIDGRQQSGYGLLELHLERDHGGEWSEHKGKIARVAGARIPNMSLKQRVGAVDRHEPCGGRGCDECEPIGPVVYNLNTLETVGRII